MKAMILAAGLGTRLRPLTNDRPKALVEVAGRTMLEMTIARLRAFGVNELIVNVHHFAEEVVTYLRKHDNFGMRIEVSREEVLLDTGGGLKKAAWFFLEGGSQQPFLLHNVDVVSDIDLAAMVLAHGNSAALATLAVQGRPSSRQLLFDEGGWLCGRRAGEGGGDEIARASGAPNPLAFCGIHVVSPQFLKRMTGDGPFSIIDTYLQLAAEGEKIAAFRADNYYWRDLGKPEALRQAARDFDRNLVSRALQ
jgi:NDP-sugar pyrophosphorylase family protein